MTTPTEDVDPDNGPHSGEGYCYFHDSYEPDNPCYRICGECFHVYPTAENLIDVYNTVGRELEQFVKRMGVPSHQCTPLCGGHQHVTETDAEMIFFCPYCTHDF